MEEREFPEDLEAEGELTAEEIRVKVEEAEEREMPEDTEEMGRESREEISNKERDIIEIIIPEKEADTILEGSLAVTGEGFS